MNFWKFRQNSCIQCRGLTVRRHTVKLTAPAVSMRSIPPPESAGMQRVMLLLPPFMNSSAIETSTYSDSRSGMPDSSAGTVMSRSRISRLLTESVASPI